MTLVVATNNIGAAYLDLLRTADVLTRGAIGVLKAEDLSTTHYNALRILRGSPQGLTCGEIASRMSTRDPDITRLLDRVEKRGLILRAREKRDRRTVLARMPKALSWRIGWINRFRRFTASSWGT